MDKCSNSDVRIWLADFNDYPQRMEWVHLLSPAERERAERFHFDRHRERFVFAHVVLRCVLADQMNCTPGEIAYDTNHYGKPSTKTALREPVTFNMSHSGDLVLIAAAGRRIIGTDVEFMRPMNDMTAIAQRFFTPQECRRVETAEEMDRARVFFTFWTRKEAYIKAVGKGLSIPLTSFDVTTSDGKTNGLLPRTEDAPDVDCWYMCDLAMPENYAGAIVVEGRSATIQQKHWELPRDII